MDELQLLIELHKSGARQGPGSTKATEQALLLADIASEKTLRVADIGCGTGASSLVLARSLNAHITAVDFLQEFLDKLEKQVREEGIEEKITTLCASMDDLPFAEASLDLIWSEGAIYNMGFEAGISAWRDYIKPGGLLVVSEITWLTAHQPDELRAHWQAEYPEIATASQKIAALEKHGYSPVGYFVLPESCWLENYYGPMEGRFKDFLDVTGNSEEAQAIVAAERKEMDLYNKYKNYYGYGVYIARKLSV